jgi:UDP-N-acetylmuramoyl-L-alanyl-D-glutamate--2,6-diaminopimelate ligase
VTSDNPRSEDPAAIIDQILPGLNDRAWLRMDAADLPACPGRGYAVEADRRAAIQLAVRLAGRDDVVLIAGKGHEDYQIVGAQRLDFDDRVEARRALLLREEQLRDNGAGP